MGRWSLLPEMILDRVKPLDAILAAAEKKSLHRSLGALQLMLFGIGCIIGTGIFVLTAAGAQKAGPGLLLAFVIAGAVAGAVVIVANTAEGIYFISLPFVLAGGLVLLGYTISDFLILFMQDFERWVLVG